MGRIDTGVIKANVDLVELVGRYSELRGSGHEQHGPCPKCGGTDRFVVNRDKGWFCRQCHTLEDHGWSDCIEFIQWMDGVDFLQAVDRLSGGLATMAPAVQVQAAVKQEKRSQRPSGWRQRATELVDRAQSTLWSDSGKAGRDYLTSRGLTEDTVKLYGLGYLDETPTAEKASAIVMPWYRNGEIEAVRFRFLQTQAGVKIKSYSGSRFGGLLYGGHVLPGSDAVGAWTLVICEGELNAMSIKQAAGDSRLDVLSIGSESSKLSSKAVEVAMQYGIVLIWTDKREVSDRIALQIPGSYATAGHHDNDGDANDLLQAGLLPGFLAGVRFVACNNDRDKQERLLWDLYDGAHENDEVRELIKALAAELGRTVDA